MSHHFNLCPECLSKYQSLRFSSSAQHQLNVMPLCSLTWPDEHPDGEIIFGAGHNDCRDAIIRLASARTALWRFGNIPEDLKELWDEARQLIPEWPGYQRLSLNEGQMESLDGCRDELDDLMGAIRKDFPNVTITDDRGGLSRFTARRDPADTMPATSPTTPRPWWQFWK